MVSAAAEVVVLAAAVHQGAGSLRIMIRTYLKNNLSAHGRCCETVQNAHILRVCSAFSPFCAPGGGISQSSTCALNTNLIFEIGSS